MARTTGSRDRRYDERRQAIIVQVRARLSEPGGSRASLRELASSCSVSLPTLRHYFPHREDLIVAVLNENLAQGEPHLTHIATPIEPFETSIREMLGYIAYGFEHGLGELHTLGLTEGLRHPVLGPAFVELVLEPSIEAVRRRLEAHVSAGAMSPGDTRHAALILLAPVTLALLHQRELGGQSAQPLSVERLLDEHAAAFVRAFASRSVAASTS